MSTCPPKDQAKHVFEANRPGWVNEMRAGDFIVAGRNFGMGSSRPAPMVLNALSVGCVLADSINALFFRNCVSFGLLALECPGVSEMFQEGQEPSLFRGFQHRECRNRREAHSGTGACLAYRNDATRRHFSVVGKRGVDRAQKGRRGIKEAASQ